MDTLTGSIRLHRQCNGRNDNTCSGALPILQSDVANVCSSHVISFTTRNPIGVAEPMPLKFVLEPAMGKREIVVKRSRMGTSKERYEQAQGK